MKKSMILTAILCITFLFVSYPMTSMGEESKAVKAEEVVKAQVEHSEGHYLEEMLRSHPSQPIMDVEDLAEGIQTLCDCAHTCVICADACVGEKDPMLTRCARINQDCANICMTTAKILSRQTEAPKNIIISQLKTCALACRECGQECKKHAEKYGHCRICADVCLNCEKVCQELIEELEED